MIYRYNIVIGDLILNCSFLRELNKEILLNMIRDIAPYGYPNHRDNHQFLGYDINWESVLKKTTRMSRKNITVMNNFENKEVICMNLSKIQIKSVFEYDGYEKKEHIFNYFMSQESGTITDPNQVYDMIKLDIGSSVQISELLKAGVIEFEFSIDRELWFDSLNESFRGLNMDEIFIRFKKN